MTRAMATPNRFAQALRDTIIPVLSHLTPFQHAFVQRLSGLGIAYEGSPIVEGGGERYFDDSLRGGEGIRSRFLLMIGEGADHRLERPRGSSPIRSATSSSSARDPLQGIALVRPDGYLAFSTRHEGAAALESVRSVMESMLT